jgi:hypothetical protein
MLEQACAQAAAVGNLELLQWMRARGALTDRDTVGTLAMVLLHLCGFC